MMHRLLISMAAAFLVLAKSLHLSAATDIEPMRIVQVDLDYVYDEDPDQIQQNLDRLVARITELKISAVFLQAFADPQGTGVAELAYFPNTKLKLRADLFGRTVTALKDSAHVKVFGWLPVLSFNFGDDAQRVLAWNPATGRTDPDDKAYRRLSPFDDKARADIITLYEEMAISAPIDGILFHDDALLSDFEDGSPAALNMYARAGIKGTIKEFRTSPKLMQKWSEFKTAALVEFTNDITKHVRAIRPGIETVRNMYASAALEPQSEQWTAQNYDLFLKNYDYTAVEAMPQMEGVEEDKTDEWLQKLVSIAAGKKNGLQKTIFELQAVDWRKQSEGKARVISSEMLANEMHVIAAQGAMNYGYYPDDFVTDTPSIEAISKEFSLPATAGQP